MNPRLALIKEYLRRWAYDYDRQRQHITDAEVERFIRLYWVAGNQVSRQTEAQIIWTVLRGLADSPHHPMAASAIVYDSDMRQRVALAVQVEGTLRGWTR